MAISQIVQNSLANTISLGAKISSIQIANSTYVVKDDTAVNVGGGYIVITGQGFQSNCSVLIGTNTACSVTFVSSTEIRAQVPAAAAGSYPVYIVNGDGGTAIRVNALTYSGEPSWVTTSPLTSQLVDTSFSIQLSATGATIYQLQAGSTLPSGVTLASNGVLSGTVTGIGNDTTYNFTVEAIDAENQESPKALAITISGQYLISRSLRFNSADSAYLSRTPGSTGNRKTWTWSGWVKRSDPSSVSSYHVLMEANGPGGATSSTDGRTSFMFNDTNAFHFFTKNVNGANLVTSPVFRDLSAWYHVVVAVDTSQATNSNRVKIYINGSQVTSFSSSTYPSLNEDTAVNSTTEHRIGKPYDAFYFNGYMAEIHFVDGTALTPDTFGKYDNTRGGVWVPKTVSGVTYGTNGFYLPFSDNTSTTTLGNDGTANNNDWTLNNFSVASGVNNDSLLDSPTPYGTDTGVGGEVRGNYCTLNPLQSSGATLSNGNLNFSATTDSGTVVGTMAIPTTGKWYFECTPTTVPTTSSHHIGVQATNALGYAEEFRLILRSDGNVYNQSGLVTTITGYTTNDVVGVALDSDAGTIQFYKNGSVNGSAQTVTNLSAGNHKPYNLLSNTAAGNFNFGQRPFAYTAPSGHKALTSQNLPIDIAANTTSTLANSYFDVVTYSGDGASSRSFTNLNFRPDLVWLKARTGGDTTFYHRFASALMPDNNYLSPSSQDGYQSAVNGYIDSFDSNGFTVVKGGGGTNDSGSTYVAWCWNAGGATVTNTSGTKSAQVRANPTAGFSIVTYSITSASSTISTFGHGLGVAPAMVFLKVTDATDDWTVYHKSIGTPNSNWLTLNSEAAAGGSTSTFSQSSTTFGVRETRLVGSGGSGSVIAHCWAEIEGFSKFGSYVGNGSSNGPFIYTGFRPAFILTKDISAGSYWWEIVDSKRTPINPASETLYANRNEGVYTSGYDKDLLSNGFKPRSSNAGQNANGVTYVYAAFAENPFKYARAK